MKRLVEAASFEVPAKRVGTELCRSAELETETSRFSEMQRSYECACERNGEL